MKKFEDILVHCIEDIKAGRASVEDCLDRYPSMRERLEPLLRIAYEIREPPDVKPSPTFKVRARVWLIEQIHGMQAVTKWPWSRYNRQTKQAPQRRRFGMASIILVIVLTLSAVGGGTAYAAQDSLPGDALYPLKLSTEQLRMVVPGDDIVRAERALNFVERRMREMEALAELGRLQDLDLAVEKYDDAVNLVLARIERADDKSIMGNVTAWLAEATAKHLSRLDAVYDMVPEDAKGAIANARNISATGHFRALEALARANPERAMGINQEAMEGRLIRVRAGAAHMEAVEIALQQFEAMVEFGEEISRIAAEVGKDVDGVEELVAGMTSEQLSELAYIWDMVPEQAQPAIERLMTDLMIRHQERVKALEQKGVEAPQPPVIQEGLRERVEERVQEQQKEWSVPDGLHPSPARPFPGCRSC